MEHTYNKLSALFDGTENQVKLGEVKYNMMPDCYLTCSLSYILSDQNPLFDTLDDRMVNCLVNLNHEFNSAVWYAYTQLNEKKLDLIGLLEYRKHSIYHVKIVDEYRVATEQEVDSGIMELVDMPQYIISNEIYKNLITLVWCMKGYARHYRELNIGELHYTDNNERIESDFDLIKSALNILRDMIDWISEDINFDIAIRQLKAAKKAGKYKYPKIAIGEITPEMTIKQVIYVLNAELPYKASGEMFKAKMICKKVRENPRYKITTDEKILLRRVYHRIKNPDSSTENEVQQELAERNVIIKNRAEELLEASKVGLIESNHFAFKIIGTLKSNNFKFISKKQESIISDAYLRMTTAKNERDEMIRFNKALEVDEETKSVDSGNSNVITVDLNEDIACHSASKTEVTIGGTPVKSSDKSSIASLSDILGSGLMEGNI